MLVTMQLSRLLSLLLVITFAACAGQTYRAEVGPMFARARGEFTLANSAQFLPPNNSLDGNMGLGETEVAPYVALRTDYNKHRVRLNGFYLDSEGSATLANAYGNIAAGTTVQTTMDFFAIASNYSYEVMREDHYRIGIGAQLGFYSLDVGARSAAGREEVTSEVFVPMPYLEIEGFWKDFTVGANMGIMSADLGDASGRYIDLEGYANWAINESYDVKLGYRYLLLDGYGRASSRDFDADVDVQGLYLSAGIRF
ncbi:MAG: hypothetical protein ACI85K_000888 [Hyphomicrobiaceae bacterium]|jgi:hypothetical protein